jgi:type IV pilus assembly protein PilM
MLKRNGRNRNLVGLDIGSSSVKVVELQGKPGSLTLQSLAHEGLQPDTVVDGQIMELNAVSHTIAHVFAANQIKTAAVAAGVSGSSVIVKNIIVPPMTEDELQESIEWHAEEHIPFDISDVALDYQITGKTPDSLHVLMAACKRDFVANIRQAIQLAGKQPCVIDVDAFALQNCYEVNYEPQPGQTVALLNVGASTSNINIVDGARSVFTRDVSFGGNQYTAALQKEFGLTFEQAEQLKCSGKLAGDAEPRNLAPVFESVSDTLVLEVQKTFDFFRATSDNGQVQKILLSGGGSKLPRIADFLAENFGVPVEFLDPFRKIKINGRRYDPDYLSAVVPEMAVAVGLALRGVAA